INTDTFRLHPDFTDDTSFNVEYFALEWEEFNANYIKDGEDIFTFQPIENYNVSVLYTGYTTSETFSVQYIVPEGQYKVDYLLFPSIYVLAQLTGDDESIRVFELTNEESQNFITQEAADSYNYIIDFNAIEVYLQNTYDPNYELVMDSYIYVLAEYDSVSLSYQMGHTPFNYEYIQGFGGDHDAYHIALYIDDVLEAYSGQAAFDVYVSKIENGLIYFKDDAGISPHSTIKLTYKFKLQPGLIDRKHFMIITYPWTNSFDTILDSLNPVDSAQSTYREEYRKLSGGSIITPFEYSLSIENKYSLYLTYRLNQKDYYENKFEIKYENFDSAKGGYVYEFMSQELGNYIDVLEYNAEDSINVYYFNALNQMTFLDPSHFEVDLSSREIIIKNDANELANLRNRIKEFYVSFIPVSNDRELTNYRFSFDPTKDIIKTMNMNYWEILDLEELGVIPNLDAFYYLDEGQSTLQNTVCYASQIAAYINNGEELEFNIEGENPEIADQINDGDYLAMYIETNIKNIESLVSLTIKLYDNSGVMSTQTITRDELIMQDNTIRINLPTGTNTLKTIRFKPNFKINKEYSDDNTHGISQMQTIQWDSNYVSFMDDDKEYMQVKLEYDLKSEIEGFELAYIYDDELQYLTFPVDTSLSSTVEDYGTGIDTYMLHIPKTYLHPETSQPTDFQEEQIIMIRYNTPVKKGIAIGIGKMYFESKGYNYDDRPDLPKAEFLLVDAENVMDAENEKEYNLMENDDFAKLYSQFMADYYYQSPLSLTPFDTEFNGRYKTVKIDLDLTSLYTSTASDMLNFSYLIFSVPNPSYELTVSEVLILEEAYEPTIEHVSTDSRVWQYSEVETFTASATPEADSYQLVLEDTPLFYPDIKWLDYLNIFDEDGNYYTAGVTGNDHQLHYEPSTDTFTWNPSFNQFPDYFGMEFEEPLIIESGKKLYFTYTTDTSWTEPIRIDIENVDLSSIRMIYDYNYLLKPEYYDWYPQQFNVKHSYESIAYSFKDEPEYEVVQYYYEDFVVYDNT
ncbi:hypothetical protein LCGC14_1678300, partial [marine sediment metagenome]